MSHDQELERRRALASAGQTDRTRWEDPRALDPAWAARAKLAATMIPRGARVLDLGCGAMSLEGFLPDYCEYLPCDLVARDERTLVCDLNRGEFPQADWDVAAALGLLEYLTDAPGLLRRLGQLGRPVVFSYHLAGEGPADRRALGWINDYKRADLPELMKGAGFHQAVSYELGNGQLLLRADPRAPKSAPLKTVWVVSYASAGNFGDRLGVHLLSQVVPPNAVVRHISHDRLEAPEGSPDLLILGLGNSLFSRLLSDELLALLDRAPRRIGIFGTQYRDALPVDRLNAVLDRLDTWHARYEEDALIYGRGRSNVRHLGDWLIDAFPMATPAIDDMLEIRSTDVHGASLDRVISQIQMYKRVTSGRLHPLMCALTSAEAVAYDEQDEMGEGLSGKFRSMLIDVFGREPPPQQLWRVNRPAVVSYKQKVRAGVRTLTADIAQVLA